jgi:hypothetical protein
MEDIPARESVPVLLLHLDAEAGIVSVPLIGYGEEIAFFRAGGILSLSRDEEEEKKQV